MSSEDLFLIKAPLLNTALSSYENFSSDQSIENLIMCEFKALRYLSKTKQKYCHSKSR